MEINISGLCAPELPRRDKMVHKGCWANDQRALDDHLLTLSVWVRLLG